VTPPAAYVGIVGHWRASRHFDLRENSAVIPRAWRNFSIFPLFISRWNIGRQTDGSHISASRLAAMRAIPTGIAGLFLLWPAAALPAVQAGYVLKCEGNMSALDDTNAAAHGSPFTMTLHLDLDHKLFCQDSCETREKISKVLPSNIILRAVSAPLPNRLWIADNGQFSYTWAEAAARDEKPSMRSAQGFCTKVVAASSIDRDNAKQKMTVPEPPVGQSFVDRPRSREFSVGEIRALINVRNHRPISGSMHTRLWLKGLARFDDDQWVLTDKGEAIIGGERR